MFENDVHSSLKTLFVDCEMQLKRITRRPLPEQNLDLPTDLHPLLRRIYALRKVTDSNELERGLDRLLPFTQMNQVEQGASLLHSVIKQGGLILVIGDFDADGATSTALAVRALRAMGGRVDYLVPNRFIYGYGLTTGIANEALRLNPSLILTVDNGISSLEGTALLKQAGVRVIITDHHLPGASLPDADVIVNPNCRDNRFPSKNLAGVGVLFYLLAALRSRLRQCEWFSQRELDEPNLAVYLDLVALGTVADMVPLDWNNRILVHQGLQRIRAGRCCVGIKALIEVGGRKQNRVVSADLGFVVAPRLNAAGRLDDMSTGIECLITDNPDRAREIATRLNQMNHERKQIEHAMQQQALADISSLFTSDTLPPGISIFRPEWHQGIIGILAARIKERYHRPVIALAKGDNGELKGSARSIQGVHIRDALEAVATANPGLLIKYGGHAMAAGLTIKSINLDRFSGCFTDEIARRVDPEILTGDIQSDGALEREDYSLELAELLRFAGPWGQDFPEPLFDGRFNVVTSRLVAEKHLKLQLDQLNGGPRLDAIAFNQSESLPEDYIGPIHAAFRLDVNEYRNNRTLQLVVEHLYPDE